VKRLNKLYKVVNTKLGKYTKPVLFIVGFGIIGLATLLVTQAATSTVSFEAEANLSGIVDPASVVTDGTASGGKAIKFGTASTPPPPTGSCDLNATTTNFASQVLAAAAGKTICLATGNYGTWSGTNKAIVIAKQTGATPSMDLDFDTGDSGFTVEGLNIGSATIMGGAKNITIRNADFSDTLLIDGVTNSNILIDNSTFMNQNNNANCSARPARIHLAYYSTTPSGVTVQNSIFDGGNKDGIQTATGMTIKNNIFRNIREKSASDCAHTDAIQGVGASNMVVTGNLFHNNADGIVEFEESTNWTITNNACYSIDRGACITLYSDLGSTVEHNTAKGIAALELDRKSGNRAGSGTVFRNNVGSLSANSGSSTSVNSNNLFSGASAPNVNGSPSFAGGANPTTWAGFKLAAGSPGINAGSDGKSVGIN
jgi:hypothetical protein